jgi:superfamily I DNA/RNA helicase
MKEIRKIAVYGAAGTGKTVLAAEEAIRCAEENKKVLFVCYNSPLAEYLNKKIGYKRNIDVFTFHKLCSDSAAKADLKIPSGVPEDILFRYVYPDLLTEAFRTGNVPRYDAIIIDEGQDFFRNWTDAVMETLNPEGPGIVRIFLDNNQRIYDSLNPVPADFQKSPVTLSRNLRNTKKIFHASENYYSGPPVTPAGPEGIDIEYFETKQIIPEVRKTLEEVVQRLIFEEKILPEDITVLLPSVSELKKIIPAGKIGIFYTTDAGNTAEGYICADTLRRFKGLESSVLIIVGTPDIYVADELMYVGITRAKSMLIFIGNDFQRFNTPFVS